MRNSYALFRVLMKNSEMKLPKKGKKGTAYLSLGMIALCCIMIPCCIVVGFVSYVMTEALTAAGTPLNGLLAEIHIMSAFSVVFGLLVIFNILFFSSDREHLVPLPFKSHEILAAKFAYAFWAESMMEFIVLLSMFIGFFLSYGWHPAGILTGLAATFLIPLLPMAYCAIIGLLIMLLLGKIRSTNLFHHMSTIILLLFVALFLLSFRDMGGITVENYVNSLADNSNLFVTVLNKIFYAVPVLIYALENNSLPALLLYIAASLLSVAILLFLGKYLYQPGLYTAAALGSAKKKSSDIDRYIVKRSHFRACLQKEWLVLTRTKAYSVNCVLINLLWPLALLIFLYMGRNKETLLHLIALYRSGNEKAALFLTLGVVAVTFLATAMNSLASTAFTREGAHLSLIKYIPVQYRTQLYAKAAISVFITFPAMLSCIVICGVAVRIPPLYCLYYCLLSLAVIVLTTVIGLVLDSAHPHDSWDDEYSALRGNLNSFFDMAVVMVISILIIAVSLLAYEFTPISLNVFHMLLAAILCAAAVLSVVLGEKTITENMKSL